MGSGVAIFIGYLQISGEVKQAVRIPGETCVLQVSLNV